MAALDCDCYTAMIRYAKSVGLNDLQARFYADTYFDYWFLDKPINCVNIYGKLDSRSAEAG